MSIQLAGESEFRLLSLSANELTVRALRNGCIYSIEYGDILVNQILGSPLAGSVHRVYLRVLDADSIRLTQIVGPDSTSKFAPSTDRFKWSGSCHGVDYRCTLRVNPGGEGWFFHVEAHNRNSAAVRCDAVLIQDLGLATRGQVRNNESFTSQYLDHTAVERPDVGWMLMTRQNLRQDREKVQTYPWLMQGCFPRARGFITEGLALFGLESRTGAGPAALSKEVIGHRVRQGELAHTAIQSGPIELQPGAKHAWSFFAHVLPDHPQRSTARDAEQLDRIQAMHEQALAALEQPAAEAPMATERSVFQTSAVFAAETLDPQELDARYPPDERRHEERNADGQLLSFFCEPDARHVALMAKELSCVRPHGHILRSGVGLTPDAEVMSCTCLAAGVFASQLTLGNTSLAKILSTARDPLNLVRSSGLRVFVRGDSSRPWQQLAVPSAFEMSRDSCRWIYERDGGCIEVTCTTSDVDPILRLAVRVDGRPLELLISGEIAAGSSEYDLRPTLSIDESRKRITIQPDPASRLAESIPDTVFHVVTAAPEVVDALGGDELLFADGRRRGYPCFAIRTRATRLFSCVFLGALGDRARAESLCSKYEVDAQPAEIRFWTDITASSVLHLGCADHGATIADTLTWFARDAVVHLATPRGLEQTNGGAWGVRDVCQGPVEFLLSYDHTARVAEVLRTLFAQQYSERGDWPQWFMFPPFADIRAHDCHGDVVIWPLKALCDYLEHSDDAGFLHERLCYTDDEKFAPTERRESVLEHVDRLLARLKEQFVAGVALPKYGEGDWDDSLQPADPALRERMISSWTAELAYQSLRRWSAVLTRFGQTERAASAQDLAEALAADFHRLLMPEGVVAGFAILDGSPARPIEYLLHPSDVRTGLKYRLIPMTRGILSEIFSPDEASTHLELIRKHLLFPDGARLMDRPTTYDGGIEGPFRRSQSAAFFGREIGVQYVHAHLRYAEALAKMGLADELWQALLVVNPIAVTEVVNNARRRQRNCYFSSSDAAFVDRYDASRNYDMLRNGDVPVDGGWRIYSSGPGIYTSLVIRHLFGLRRYFDWVEFDPVLPRELDGAAIELLFDQCRVRFQYAVKGASFSPARITVNGVVVPDLTPVPHRYRRGGIRVKRTVWDALLNRDGENLVQIEL